MITKRLPHWVTHIIMNRFLNQDSLFLHVQERNRHNSGEYTTIKAEGDKSDVYANGLLPIAADKVRPSDFWLLRRSVLTA